MKNLPNNLLYMILGLSLGVSGTFIYINPKFTMLEQDSLQLAKISFLRGCTQNNTLETCKKHPGYTDNQEIFQKIDALEGSFIPQVFNAEGAQDLLQNFTQLMLPPDSKALKLSGEDQREVQKMIQGRHDKNFNI